MKSKFVFALGLAALCAASFAKEFNLGDKVPGLKIAAWVKGAPVDLSKGLHVVEFWATWCGPCKVSIPHITELAKKYAGKVDFTGVSVWEDQTNEKFLDKVKDFVAEMGDKMNYNVAAEGTDKWMAENWLKPADENGIPTSFVVKDGVVLWIGHPQIGLDEALTKIIAGKYDLKATKAQRDRMKAEEARQEKENEKMAELMRPVSDAAQGGDFKTAAIELDKVMQAHKELVQQLAIIKQSILMRTDEAAAAKYALEISKTIYRNDQSVLNSLAWAMVEDKSAYKQPNYEIAVEIAKLAVAASKEKDGMILDTLGYAYFKAKKLDLAIATQEKAVAALKKQDQVDPTIKKEIEDRLDMFKKLRG